MLCSGRVIADSEVQVKENRIGASYVIVEGSMSRWKLLVRVEIA